MKDLISASYIFHDVFTENKTLKTLYLSVNSHFTISAITTKVKQELEVVNPLLVDLKANNTITELDLSVCAF